MEIQSPKKISKLRNRSAALVNYVGIRLAHNGAVKLSKKLIILAMMLNPQHGFYRRNYRYVLTQPRASKLMIFLLLLNKLDKSRNTLASLFNALMVLIVKVGHHTGLRIINCANYLDAYSQNVKRNKTLVSFNINNLNRLLPVTTINIRTQLLSVKAWCLQQKLSYFPIKTDQKFFIAAPQVFEPPSLNTHTGSGVTVFPDIYLANVKDATVIPGSSLILVDNRRILIYDELTYVEEGRYGVSNHYVTSVKNNIVNINIARSNETEIVEAIHFCKDYSSNFYHWLVECLPRFWVIEQFPELKKLPLIIDNELIPQQLEALHLFNKDKHAVIPLKRSVAYNVKNLYIPSPLSLLNDNYVSPVDYASDTLISPIAINYIRETVLKNLDLTARNGHRKLFISRKLATYRHIINANEIESFMIDQGFEIVYLEHLSFANQVTLFSQAKIIVGQEGAGMANLIFAPSDCKMLILINHHPQTNYYEFTMLAQAVDIKLVFLPGKDVIGREDQNKHNNFIIDTAKLSKALKSL